MISQKLAVQCLLQEMRGSSIPMAPEHFRVRRFRDHDVVFFGHVQVSAFKRANRWQFEESEVRSAGRALAALPWDPQDLVDPRPAPDTGVPAVAAGPTGWRFQLRRAIAGAGATARTDNGCPCGTPCRRQDRTGWELPCGLTARGLLDNYARYAVACTLPVPTLVWTDETWLIPRTLAWVLDRWQEREAALSTGIGSCDACGAPGTDPARRTSTTNGWKTLCPACTLAGLHRYRQELTGTTYARVREQGPAAEDFLCTMCQPPRAAAAWDHCHEHGLIRGPLCGSCNTMEGHGKEFLARHGGIQHLLACTACRTQRTLPAHHRRAALRRHLHRERGVRGCDWPLHMCVSLTEAYDGGYTGEVRCPGQRDRSPGLRVTAGDVDRILALAIESAMTT